MKQSKKNSDNNIHIYGFINDVNLQKTSSDRTAINLDVVTLEQWTEKGEAKSRRSQHDVALFTEDKALIAKFEAIAKDTAENAKNRNVEGYKPKVHTISMDGALVNDERPFKGMDKTYQTIKIIAREDSIDLDVPQVKGEEKRNHVELTANISEVYKNEEKKFAALKVANNLHTQKGSSATWLDVNINGNSPFPKEKAAYEAIIKGDLKKGDFIKLSGMMRNRDEKDLVIDGKKTDKYGFFLSASSIEKIERKLDKTQKEETSQKEAPAETKQAKQTKQPKKTPATSRKKAAGPKVG